MKKLHHVQIPISFLPSLYNKKVETIDNMLYFGIYRLSKTVFKINDINTVVNQFIYLKYNGNNNEKEQIENLLKNQDLDFFGQGNRNGFTSAGGEWEPDAFEVEELSRLFEVNKKQYELCCEFYNVYQTLKNLSVSTDKTSKVIEKGKELEVLLESKIAYAMASIDVLIQYRNNDKSISDLDQLVANLAIRSIIGEKEYILTNRNMIFARMLGYTRINDIPNKETINGDSKRILDHYSKRYQFEKLVEILAINWKLTNYSYHTRGIYFGKISLEKLIKEVELKKNKSKINKANKKQIREDVLKGIFNGEMKSIPIIKVEDNNCEGW